MERAAGRGFAVEGPFPSDTVFLRAKDGEFDAVLTMYHDQGQIAMKLMGFDRGVTLIGGFPFPICTPAHGTAYDIAGKGIANVGASREALLLAIRIGAGRSSAARRRPELRLAAEAAASEPPASQSHRSGGTNEDSRPALLAAVVAARPVAGAAQAQWKPTKPIEFVVTSGAGGGTDNFARVVQSIIAKHKLADEPIVVTNKGGG